MYNDIGGVGPGPHVDCLHAGGWMSVDPKTNEWNLLKHQFDALVHDESVSAESIDEIFDAEFCRRFTELINQTAQRTRTNVYNWPRRF